jgi:phage-related protein
MAGPGGSQVGQVYIRVVPDASGFRRKLDAQLRSQLAGVDRNVKVIADVDARTAGVREKIQAGLSGLSVDVDTNFRQEALDRLQQALAQVRSEADKALFDDAGRGLAIRVRAELDQASKAEIRSELQALERLTFRLEPRLDDSLGDRIRARLALERLAVPVEPVVKPGYKERIQARLDARKFTVPVNVDWDRNGLTRGLASVGTTAFTTISKGLYNVGSGIATVVGGLARMRQGTLLVLAVLALIAPALALISGLIVTLPAAFAAITVPIAAIALGLDGIKKAAEVSKAEFESLKKVMSDRWQANLTPVFEQLNQLGPMLRESMPKVADGLTAMAQGFTDAVTSAPGMAAIKNTIENIGEALGRSKQGVTDFTNGLLNLVSALSDKFPGLADAFNRTGKSFLDWVDKITEKGPGGVSQLDTAMKSLGDTLTALNGLLGDFFRSGWDNLTNGDFAGNMRSFVDSIRSLVQDTLPALARGFEGIASALKPVAVIVDAIDKTLSALGAKLPDVNDFKNELSGGSVDKLLWGDKVGGWIEGLRAKIKGETKEVGQEAAASLADGLAQGLDAGASLGAASFGGLDKVGQAVSEQIKNAVKVSAEDQKQALRSAFTAGGVDTAVSQQLTQQVTAAVQGAKNAMANLGPELQGLIDTALMPLATIADRVGQAFSTMGPAINNAFIAAMAGVRNTITGLFAFMVLAIGTQTSKISNSIGQAFQGAPQQVGAALAGVPGAVAGALAPAIAAAANAAVGMLQAMNAGLAALPAVVQAWFGAVPATVQGAMSPAIGTVASVCQQIVSTMLSFAGAAEQAGTAIGASFAKGIASATNLVISSASALMNAARAFFPASPAEKGPFSGSGWVDNSGKAVGEGFAAGMQSSVGGVVDIARVMMQQVKDVFGNAEGLVINFNFNEVAQPISQFSNSIAGIGTSMAGALPAAQEFQQTLGQTGQSLAMLDSSQSKGRIEELKKSLLELEIQRKQLEAARDMPGADQAAIKAQIEQIRNQKNLLGLERDKLTYAQKYGGQMSSTAQSYKEQMNSLQQIPFDFATATSNQFMSDLGWSGQGAIPSLMQQGMDFGTNFIFNVANMDDALSGQRVLQNRTAQATLGR